jgi:hypothetical protein
MSSTAAAGKKEKGNLTGKKETIIVNGRSLFVVGHYHDERLSCPGDSGELFPFPILLVFSFLAVATRQSPCYPPWLCILHSLDELIITYCATVKGVNLFLFYFSSILFQRVTSKNPAFDMLRLPLIA